MDTQEELRQDVVQKISYIDILDRIYLSVNVPGIWEELILDIINFFGAEKLKLMLTDNSGVNIINEEVSSPLSKKNGKIESTNLIEIKTVSQYNFSSKNDFYDLNSYEKHMDFQVVFYLYFIIFKKNNGVLLSEEHKIILDKISKHICKSLSIKEILNYTLSVKCEFLEVLEKLNKVVILVDKDMNIIFKSPNINKVLRSYDKVVKIKYGVFKLCNKQDDLWLQRAVNICSSNNEKIEFKLLTENKMAAQIQVFGVSYCGYRGSAIILKEKNNNINICRSTLKDTWSLSDREIDVISCFAKKPNLKIVSSDLNISYETARWHLKHIMTKFGVNNQAELISRVFCCCVIQS